jgi:hypothetical protein
MSILFIFYCATVGCVVHIPEELDASFFRVLVKKDTGNGHIKNGSLSHVVLMMGHKRLSSSAPSREYPVFLHIMKKLIITT